MVVYFRDQAEAEATVEEILAANSTSLAVRANLAHELDVERVFTETNNAVDLGRELRQRVQPRLAIQ